jgi:hypothetical protein
MNKRIILTCFIFLMISAMCYTIYPLFESEKPTKIIHRKHSGLDTQDIQQKASIEIPTPLPPNHKKDSEKGDSNSRQVQLELVGVMKLEIDEKNLFCS